MTSVACIGECMIELAANGDGSWKLGFAGDTFNTLWALRALLDPSAATDYVTAFGDDPFSRQQIDFLRDNGIGTARSPILPGARPGLYAITLTGAERSFTYWRSDAAARQLASNPDELALSLKNQTLIYFSGITLAILDEASRAALLNALAEARLNGSRIAFDPNYRPRLWPDADTARTAIAEALALTDIALPTFPDEQALHGDATPEETAQRLAAADIPEIVVKNGEMPCLVLHYGQSEMIPAVQVDAVDTTGAGDSFNGGYLAARLKGHSPAEAARLAHAIAAHVVQVRGALASFDALRKAFAA
ncbi:MAG: sugar kinase [Rhizobiaceae bacterium]|nr:sugar kinase [Rhizobiaceae bacterium]